MSHRDRVFASPWNDRGRVPYSPSHAGKRAGGTARARIVRQRRRHRRGAPLAFTSQAARGANTGQLWDLADAASARRSPTSPPTAPTGRSASPRSPTVAWTHRDRVHVHDLSTGHEPVFDAQPDLLGLAAHHGRAAVVAVFGPANDAEVAVHDALTGECLAEFTLWLGPGPSTAGSCTPPPPPAPSSASPATPPSASSTSNAARRSPPSPPLRDPEPVPGRPRPRPADPVRPVRLRPGRRPPGNPGNPVPLRPSGRVPGRGQPSSSRRPPRRPRDPPGLERRSPVPPHQGPRAGQRPGPRPRRHPPRSHRQRPLHDPPMWLGDAPAQAPARQTTPLPRHRRRPKSRNPERTLHRTHHRPPHRLVGSADSMPYAHGWAPPGLVRRRVRCSGIGLGPGLLAWHGP